MIRLLNFILGSLFGGTVGVFTMAIFISSKKADDKFEL